MATTKNDIHELTRAEIARQKQVLVARREAIVNQRCEIYASMRKSGGASQNPISAVEMAARMHAKRLLNGAAPQSLVPVNPSSASLDQELEIEQRGIDITLKILSDKDLEARAVEAVEWAEANRERWRELCKEVVLASARLDALGQTARDMMESCPDLWAINLPLGNLMDTRQMPEPFLRELTDAAISAGVVSRSEIKKATAR
jgi:hypothetical protein